MCIIMLFSYGVVHGLTGLNVEDLKQRTYKFFGPGSEYDTPVNDPYRDKGGRLNPLEIFILFTFLLVIPEIFQGIFVCFFTLQQQLFYYKQF